MRYGRLNILKYWNFPREAWPQEIVGSLEDIKLEITTKF